VEKSFTASKQSPSWVSIHAEAAKEGTGDKTEKHISPNERGKTATIELFQLRSARQ